MLKGEDVNERSPASDTNIFVYLVFYLIHKILQYEDSKSTFDSTKFVSKLNVLSKRCGDLLIWYIKGSVTDSHVINKPSPFTFHLLVVCYGDPNRTATLCNLINYYIYVYMYSWLRWFMSCIKRGEFHIPRHVIMECASIKQDVWLLQNLVEVHID